MAFYDKPLLKFERILQTYMGIAPRGLRSFLMAGPLTPDPQSVHAG